MTWVCSAGATAWAWPSACKNIPAGTPVFLYTWVEDAIMLEQLWTPKDEQLKENRPETFPVYSS